MPLSSNVRNPSLNTLGGCKCLLCSWDWTFLAPTVKCIAFTLTSNEGRFTWKIAGRSTLHVQSESYRFKNGVLGPVMEHSVGTVNCCYVHAGFISRALLKIREIPSSSTLTNSAMEARGYCKYFLPLWRCNISAPSVECASFTVQSCEERVTWNLTGGSALDVE